MNSLKNRRKITRIASAGPEDGDALRLTGRPPKKQVQNNVHGCNGVIPITRQYIIALYA